MTKRSPTTKDIALLHQLFNAGQLTLAAEFQRNAVWPSPAKAYLIDTILNDRPIPLLFFQRTTSAQSGLPAYTVIDGQQRLRAIFEYLDDRFRLSQSVKKAKYYNKRFSELDSELQDRIRNYDLVIEELSGYSDDDIRDMFVRINKYVVQLSPQELRHAKGAGKFHDFVEKIGKDEIWKAQRIFSPKSVKRMKSVEFVAELTILLIDGPQDKKASIDLYYGQYRDKFPSAHKTETLLRSYLSWIAKAVPNLAATRYRKPVDLYALIGALDRVSDEGAKLSRLSPPPAGQKLLELYQRAAQLAREAVQRAVRETGALVHVVSSRAKTVESLRGKLRRKRYKKPELQVTDLIGVRVITYYRDDVDSIVARLQRLFEINRKESVDKRVGLGLRQFGYRSVHLVARVKPEFFDTSEHDHSRTWFEIQVRSILEHAWAEIEHAIVYKSGICQPEKLTRRFAALAGTLELLDGEFLGLRDERNVLIEGYLERYRHKEDLKKPFDVARLLAFLEATLEGRSWRQAATEGKPFGAGLEVSCVDAMKAVGLGTPHSLARMFKSSRYRYAVHSFAANNGIAPSEVSHLASVVLAVGVKEPRTVRQHFPEIMYDPAIRAMVERRASRRA